jgi:hypothetical protein
MNADSTGRDYGDEADDETATFALTGSPDA